MTGDSVKRYLTIVLSVIILAIAIAPIQAEAHTRCRNGYGRVNYTARAYRPAYIESRRRGLGPTGRAVLTIAAPAAIAAGVGALVGGKKGAAVGALLGGGGGAVYYLIKNRRR